MLAQENFKEELLAELLAVQDRMGGDVAARIRTGRLFLAAGSPARAADAFRAVLKDQPGNSGAYAGLGESDFAKGDYRAAKDDFSSAVRFNPGDQDAARRLDLSNRVLALDPAVRGIGAAERFRRTRILLQMALDAAVCLGSEFACNDLPSFRGSASEWAQADYSATEANLD